MRYMGGKAKIAKRIVAAILEDTDSRETWFEPFVGGGNVLEHAAPHFDKSVALDAHQDLILMWAATVAGWAPPAFISKDEYQTLRQSEPSALRGFAGFGASFGGKWFGGYGVEPRDGEVCRQSYRTVVRQGRVFQEHNVSFIRSYFGDVTPPAGSVVYCDPPYANTTGYTTGTFDYGCFYKTLGDWAAAGCAVYVSEYSVPAGVDHDVIWERPRRNSLTKDDNTRVTLEHLFKIRPSTAMPAVVAA
jgi:DNA adenine methylase